MKLNHCLTPEFWYKTSMYIETKMYANSIHINCSSIAMQNQGFSVERMSPFPRNGRAS